MFKLLLIIRTVPTVKLDFKTVYENFNLKFYGVINTITADMLLSL